MKHLMKRVFALMLCTAIALSSIPVQDVYAEEGQVTETNLEEGTAATPEAVEETTQQPEAEVETVETGDIAVEEPPQSEETGVYLGGNYHFYDEDSDMMTVIRNVGSLHASVVMGEGEMLTKWEVVCISPDGEENVIGEDHYEYGESATELIFTRLDNLWVGRTHVITAYGINANGEEVSYSTCFGVEVACVEISSVELFDDSEATVMVGGKYISDDFEYRWSVGEFLEGNEFVEKAVIDETGNSCVLTKDLLNGVWGENPSDGQVAILRVEMLNDGKVCDYNYADITYRENTVEYPYWDLKELLGNRLTFGVNNYVRVKNAEYPEGNSVDIKITSVNSDSITIEYNSEIEAFEVFYCNGDAYSGTLTFTYQMYDSEGALQDQEYEYTTRYEFKDEMYHLGIVTKGPAAWMVKGQAKTLIPRLGKSWVVDEYGYYNSYYEEIQIGEDITAEWNYDKEEAARFVNIQENSDGSLVVEAITAVRSDVFVPLQLVVKKGDEIIATDYQEISLTEAYNELLFYDADTGKVIDDEENILIGDSKTIRPAMMQFSNDNPAGTDLKAAMQIVGEDNSSSLEVVDNQDGTYTVTRVGEEYLGLYFEASKGDYTWESSLNFDSLWIDIEYSANIEEHGNFFLFTDEKTTVTADTNEVGLNVIWDWKLVVYNTSSGDNWEEVDCIDIASGKDLRSVDLDGSKYTKYMTDENDYEFKIKVQLYVDEEVVKCDELHLIYQESNFEIDNVPNEWVVLKGGSDGFPANTCMNITDTEHPWGEWFDIRIVSVESDTMEFELDSEYWLANYDYVTADSGTITIKYQIYDSEGNLSEEQYTYNINYEYKDELYWLNTITTGTQAWMVKGQKKTIQPVLYKDWVEEDDGDYDWHYGEEITITEPITAEWIYNKSLAEKYVNIQENDDGTLMVEVIRGVGEGQEVRIPLQLIVKEGEDIIATAGDEIAITAVYDQIIFYDVETGKLVDEDANIKLGESITIRPAVMRFSDEDLNGTDQNVKLDLMDASGMDTAEIIDHGDGTYTIKRIKEEYIDIYCYGEIAYGMISRNLDFNGCWKEIKFLAEGFDEDDYISLFTEDKIKLSADVDNIGKDVVWDWDFVVRDMDSWDEIARIDLARGKDLRTITLDGGKYTEYVSAEHEFMIDLNLYVDGNLARNEELFFDYREPWVDTQGDGVCEILVSKNIEILETYEGYLETSEHPNGFFTELEVRNLEILSGSDVLKKEYISDEEVSGWLFTVLKEGTAVISYDIYHDDQLVKEEVLLEINGLSCEYRGEIVTDSNKNTLFKDETITLLPEYYLEGYSTAGYLYKEELEDLRIAITDVCFECDEGCGECLEYVTITENEEGTVTYAPNGHEVHAKILMDIYAGDEKIASDTSYLYVVSSEVRVVIENEEELLALKSGESATVKPMRMRFTEVYPDGNEINSSSLNIMWLYGDGCFEVTDHKDGTYTIKRVTSGDVYLECAYVWGNSLQDIFELWVGHYDCEHIDTVAVEEKAATCTEIGYSKAEVCDSCGYRVSASNIIDRLPHKMTYHEANEATCEAGGTVEYWSCSVCEKNYSSENGVKALDTTVDEKLGHDLIFVEKVNPTYEAEGSKAHYMCDRESCGKLFWDRAAKSEITNAAEVVLNKIVYEAPTVNDESFKSANEATIAELKQAIEDGDIWNLDSISPETVEMISEALESGFDISIETVIEALEDDVVAEYLEKIEENSSYKAGDIEFKQLADISMLIVKLSDGTEVPLGQIKELEESVTLSFENVDALPKGMKYVVIRIHEDLYHNETVDVLDAKYDKDKNSVTFETDKFSVYALALVPDENAVGTIGLGQWRMHLDSVVYMNYYPVLEGFSADFDFSERAGVVIWTADRRPTRAEVVVENTADTKNIEGWHWNDVEQSWYIRTEEIYAKNLGDMIYLRPYVVDQNGEYVYLDGVVFNSPKFFSYDILKDTNSREKERYVCAALLQYGANAQLYFDYKTNDLVTTIPSKDINGVSGAYKSVNWDDYDLDYKKSYRDAVAITNHIRALAPTLDGNYKTGVSWNQSTLNLAGAIRLSVGFDIDASVIDTTQIKKQEVLFWNERDLANAETLNYAEENYNYKCKLVKATGEEEVNIGTYRAQSDHILAKYLGEGVFYTCRIEMDDGTVYNSGLGYYSPEAFAGDHIDKSSGQVVELCKQIIVYSEMAKRCFLGNN